MVKKTTKKTVAKKPTKVNVPEKTIAKKAEPKVEPKKVEAKKVGVLTGAESDARVEARRVKLANMLLKPKGPDTVESLSNERVKLVSRLFNAGSRDNIDGIADKIEGLNEKIDKMKIEKVLVDSRGRV